MTIDRKKIRWNGWGWAGLEDDMGRRAEVWSWLAGELGMPALLATPARNLDDIDLPAIALTDATLRSLEQIVGRDGVRTDAYERAFHARGDAYHDLLHLRAGNLDSAPDAVVYPRAAADVEKILQLATETGFRVVPFGGGTSVVGGVTPERMSGAPIVTLDTTEMNRVLGVDRVAMTATAEAGIYGPALETALKAQGVTLGHYPQSYEFSTLGGWIAARGAGQQSNRYGKAEEWLVSARMATPTGLWSTEGFPASAAGPNLNDLVAGSEGTLGVITDATFRIHHLPAASDYRAYLFKSFQSGVSAIRAAIQDELPVAMMRLSDADETRFFQSFGRVGSKGGLGRKLADSYLDARGYGGDNKCVMLAGVEGDADVVAFTRARVASIAKAHGGLHVGKGPAARWRHGRFHGPYLRDPMMDHGVGVDTLETATRWSNIPALYHAVREALLDAMKANAPRAGAHGVVMAHVSHSYPDGASLYFTFIFPRRLDREVEQWHALKRAASDAIAASGGTISHHHGAGADHAPWLAREKGPVGMAALRAVKQALDPKRIMNPGKLALDE